MREGDLDPRAPEGLQDPAPELAPEVVVLPHVERRMGDDHTREAEVASRGFDGDVIDAALREESAAAEP